MNKKIVEVIKKEKSKKEFNYSKNVKLIIFMTVVTFLLTTLLLSNEVYNLMRTNYEVGQVSTEKIKAPRDFINQPETDKLKKNAQENVQNYYKIDTSITEEIYNQINSHFILIDSEREDYKLYLEAVEKAVEIGLNNINHQDENDDIETNESEENMSHVAENLENGNLSEDDIESSETINYSSSNDNNHEVKNDIATIKEYEIRNIELLKILTEEEIIYLCNLDEVDYVNYKQFVNKVVVDVLEQGVKSDSLLNTFLLTDDYINKQNLDEVISNISYKVIVNFLKPNLIIDELATEDARKEAAKSIEPIYYKKGQTIIDEGEIISEDIYIVLDDLGYIEKNITEVIISYMGVILLNLIFSLFVVFWFYLHNKKYLYDKGIIALVCTLHILFAVFTILLAETWIRYMPLYIVVYLLAAFTDKKVVSVIIINILFLLSNFVPLTANELLFLFFTTNMEILFVKLINEKQKIILVSTIMSIFFGTIYLLMLITEGYNLKEISLEFYKIPLTVFISIIFAYGVVPAVASTFRLLTNSRLMELTRPDQPLIRRLTLEASGTYQHSLVVANLSEEAALEIKANSILCRVGSYYHDIGKLKKPLYFGENQNGYNPHDELNPIESANVILDHTIYGIELAKKHKLPKEIIDIIPQHHGSTKVGYFYSKAINDEKYKNKITESMFTYDGQIPQSKEAAIIMLADTSEAAVRSVIYKMKNFEEVESFITKLINSKIETGQLLDSGLTFKDIEKIKKAFMQIFKGMYHSRVEYPSKEDDEDNT